MSAPLSTVLATARTYLNDDNIITWPDQTLIPKAQEAHRELQTELWVIGSGLVRKTSNIITVPLGTTNLHEINLQPEDLLTPTAIYEASTVAEDWLPMTEQAYFPPGLQPTTSLVFWQWLDEEIKFVGCTQARRIIIHYRRLIPIPTSATDVIGILFAESYLAARTAAIAAGSVGNADAYAAMTALAKENLAKLIAANRGQQKTGIRP